MVEFDIKIHPQQRIAYIPKELYAVLSSHSKAVANRTAVLLFPEGTSRENVLKSLDIIKADLLHAQQLESEEKSMKEATQHKR